VIHCRMSFGDRMHVASRLPWTDSVLGALVQAHLRSTLPASLRLPGILEANALAAREGMPPALLTALGAALDRAAFQRFAAFEDPRALAVVTGQQPGCVGGAILVLLKAATAIALARRSRSRLGRPVVPVFWNATDDVDFDEIARVAWPTPAGEMLFLELPQEGRRAQGFVGDLPAAGDDGAAAAAATLLAPAQLDALRRVVPTRARDHGDWVAQLLQKVFPDLAVVDARLPALRQLAAPLFRRYLDLGEEPSATLARNRDALVAAGFPHTLAPESIRQPLFLVEGGRRRKTDGDPTPLWQALEHDPASVAGNVVLRPLVQDLLLPVMASVAGASEIGYLHEIHGLRALLGVPSPAVVPRLALTLLEPEAWEGVQRLDLPLPDLISDADAVIRRAAAGRVQARRQLAQEAFAALAARLDNDGVPASVLAKTRRKLEAAREEYDRGLETAATEELLGQEPGLRGLSARLRPRGRPQERSLAALWLLARWGDEAGESLVQLADSHLSDVERGEIAHWLLVDTDTARIA